MEELIAWSGFLGAWLLVAGPVFQAVVELSEEAFERSAVEAAAVGVPRPEPVSGWWWLLPPVRYLVARRRGRAYRAAVFAALAPAQQRQVIRLLTKARGWSIVGGGAFFIAVKETWEVREVHEWSTLTFWLVLAAATAVALAGTLVQTARATMATRQAEREEAAG